MPKTVVDKGAGPSRYDERNVPSGEWEDDVEITDVTIADGVTEIKLASFWACTSLDNLGFLKDSAITTIESCAFEKSGIASLKGMEAVSKLGDWAFAHCKDLRTIEGLGCDEMGSCCFIDCTLLPSIKGWPASLTEIPVCCFEGCTGLTSVACDISHVTSIGGNAFAGCTSLLPPSLSAPGSDPAAVLAFLKEKSRKEREAAREAARAAQEAAQNAVRAAQDAVRAAQAAEDSLLAELDAEDAAKKGGKKKKKKKKKASGKKGKGEEQAEPDDWRTDFQRYVQSDTMRAVDERKRQRNLEEAARIMAAHEQKIAALRPPPSLDPPAPAPPAPPDALAETMEDIEAQIAALGLPPGFDPAPPPAAPQPAAPDAFMETLLATAPPEPAQQSLMERVRSLHLEVCGADMPTGMGVAAAVALVEEGVLGGVREGGFRERVGALEELMSG
jgi:hypothetical protein